MSRPDTSSYGAIESGEASGRGQEEPVIKKDEEGGQPPSAKGGLSSWHYLAVFFVGILIIGGALAFMLTVVWDSDGGDDDDDGGGDDDENRLDCKINDPATTDSHYAVTLDRIDLDLDKYPNAVCNDGSASAYYFHPAIPEGANSTWIVMLEGGNWCFDFESCQERAASTADVLATGVPQDPFDTGGFATSSLIWANTTTIGGIFASPQCSPLFGANVIYLPYCSSDAFMSSATASPETFNMNFQGASIIDAVLNELLETHGLLEQTDTGNNDGSSDGESDNNSNDDSERPLLILSGYSAGGRGVMVNLDRVANQLKNRTEDGVDVYGVLDSVVWLETVNGLVTDKKNSTVLASDLYDISAENIDPDCFQVHATELWKCIFSEFRLKFLETPYTILGSQNDLSLEEDTANDFVTSPQDAVEEAESGRVIDSRSDIAEQTLGILIDLKEQRPELTVYSPACNTHTYTWSTRFLDFVTNGDNSTTMRIAVEKGLEKAFGVARPRIVDACPEVCNFSPFNGEAAGTEPRPFSFEDGFYFDRCEFGRSCGPCDFYEDAEVSGEAVMAAAQEAEEGGEVESTGDS